jgi:hypothetical protein
MVPADLRPSLLALLLAVMVVVSGCVVEVRPKTETPSTDDPPTVDSPPVVNGSTSPPRPTATPDSPVSTE